MTAHKLPDGDPEEVARTMPLTQWALDFLEPYERMRVAVFLDGMVHRYPLHDGDAFGPHRLFLGALAAELRQLAYDAGEEPAEPDDTPLWIERELWPHQSPLPMESQRLQDDQ